jgi:hypothetical protein
MIFRLSDLEGRRVVRDAEDLGRLMDVRCGAQPGPVAGTGAFAARALLVGARGWMQRIGLSRDAGVELKPQDIVAIEADRIVVRGAKRAPR